MPTKRKLPDEMPEKQKRIKRESEKIRDKERLDQRRSKTKKRTPTEQSERRAKYEPGKGTAWNKTRPDPETRQRYKGKPICGATRSKNYAEDPENPGVCTLGAGWGTSHKGYGKCKFHGGNAPNGIKAAEREMAAELIVDRELTYGEPRAIGPHEALLEEIHRTAGHVGWLQQMIGEMDKGELLTETIMGLTPSGWLTLYNRERDHLVNVCRAAVAAGCSERMVRLEEDKGRMIAMAMRDILWDKELELTPLQKSLAAAVVRKHLMALAANQSEADRRQLAKTSGRELLQADSDEE